MATQSETTLLMDVRERLVRIETLMIASAKTEEAAKETLDDHEDRIAALEAKAATQAGYLKAIVALWVILTTFATIFSGVIPSFF